VGCKKFMYGECTYGDRCIYSHKYTDLCPTLVRDGNCRRKKCPWLHTKTAKAEAKKAPSAAAKSDLFTLFAKASELETNSTAAFQPKSAGGAVKSKKEATVAEAA
jgi:hypothetical protein